MAPYFQFTSPGFSFKGSAGWVQDFKGEKKIRQRHMKKHTSINNSATFEEQLKEVELFQKQRVKIIPNHYLDYLINIDQMGCEHHVNIRQTISHKIVKTMGVLV
jgi:hypothetical protein